MMKFLVLAALAVLVALAGLASYKQFDARGGIAANGKQPYEGLCASCHGPLGHGDGPIASSLQQRPSDLSQTLAGLLKIDSILIERVVLGGKQESGMPAFKGMLSEQEARDIFAYIRSVNP